MALPPAVEALWNELQAARAEVLKELEGLTQAQADWRPGDKDWCIGEVIHHVTLAEVASGKLTTKLLREAEAQGKLHPFPPALTELTPLPPAPGGGPPEAPPHIWPEKSGPIGELLAEMRSVRERTRQNIGRLATVDPRPLKWIHVPLGELNLAQAWTIILNHDRMHLQHIRKIKASLGFPER